MILNKSFYVDTTKSIDLLTITHEVKRVILEGKSDTGFATVMIPNPGAGVVVMEKGVPSVEFQKIPQWMVPRSAIIPIEKGRMMMEPWQEVILIDFETSGKRREFRVQLFWEAKEAPKGPAGQK